MYSRFLPQIRKSRAGIYLLEEEIVYVGHTIHPKDRHKQHEIKFLSNYAGEKLNWRAIAINLHITQAMALEQTILMLICNFSDLS